MKSPRFVIYMCMCALMWQALADSPMWWSEINPAVIDENLPSDPGTMANLGQLKHIATQAKSHLDIALPGGSGEDIQAMVETFEPRAGQEYSDEERLQLLDKNYVPVNLGQVKAVGKVFYDRLLEAGYPVRENLIARGYPADWGFDYPWDPAVAVDENYAPANIGQLKMVFSFDLAGDVEENGLPDWWEEKYFWGTGQDPEADLDGDGWTNLQEYQSGSHPVNYYDQGAEQITPVLTIVGGNYQTGLPNQYLPEALQVEVRDAVHGELLIHVPVVFSLESGKGKMHTDAGRVAVSEELVVWTNSMGVAEVFYYQESQNGGGGRNVIRAQGGNFEERIESSMVEFSSVVTGVWGEIAHWQLEERSGVTIEDAVALQLDGTLVRDGSWSSRLNNDYALEFEGEGVGDLEPQTVKVVMPELLKAFEVLDFGKNNFTLTLWFYAPEEEGEGEDAKRGVLLGKGEAVGAPGYYLALTKEGNLEFGLGSSVPETPAETIQIRTQESFKDAQWHHVAVVVNQINKIVHLRVDGVLVPLEKEEGTGGIIYWGNQFSFAASAPLNFLQASAPEQEFYLGSRNGDSEFLLGMLDEVRVFYRALTSTEIMSLIQQSGELLAVPATHKIQEDRAGHWELQHLGGGQGVASYQIVTPPVHGTFILENMQVHYYPNAHYHGEDSFIFSVTKNEVTEEALVTIEISAVDDPPLVYAGRNQHLVFPANAFLQAQLTDIDTAVEAIDIEWVKDSGPGDVVFSEADALETMAEFSEPGEYVLSILVTDENSARSDSMRVVVLAADTLDIPTVYFQSPGDKSYYDLDTFLSLQILAEAAEGSTVDRVDFYEGSRKIGTVSNPNPVSGRYEMNWMPSLMGVYALSAVAFDSEGRSNVSETITVIVKHQGWFNAGSEVGGSSVSKTGAVAENGLFILSESSEEIHGGNDGFPGSGGNGGVEKNTTTGPESDLHGESGIRGGSVIAGGGGNGFGQSAENSWEDTDGDGVSNFEEALRKTRPTRPDTDNDGVMDGEDAVPRNKQMRVAAAKEVRYMLVDLGRSSVIGSPRGINDKGQVLLVNDNQVGWVWSEGKMHSLGEGEFFAGILPSGHVYVGENAPEINVQNTEVSTSTYSKWNYRVWNVSGWSGSTLWKEAYQLEELEATDWINVNSFGLEFPLYGDLAPLFEASCSFLDITLYGGAAPVWDFPFSQSVHGELKAFDDGRMYYHASAGISISLDFSEIDEMGEEHVVYRAIQSGSGYLGQWMNAETRDYGGWRAKGIVKTDPMTHPVTYTDDEDSSGIGPVWINADGFIAGKEANAFVHWNTNPDGVKWVKPYNGSSVQLSAAMGDVKGLTNTLIGQGEGPYFRTTSGLVAYHNGNPVLERIPLARASVFPGTPRTISDSLVIPDGKRIWRNGRFLEVWELCGEPREWNNIQVHLVSPQQNFLTGVATHTGTGYEHAVLLVPVDIAVDANRDGLIKFAGNSDESSMVGKLYDRTEKEKPFRFWLNNDRDEVGEDALFRRKRDNENLRIRKIRDLEDFARMHLHFGGIQEAISKGEILVGFKWRNTTGAPSIHIFPHVEEDGGTRYLTDVQVATQQVESTLVQYSVLDRSGSRRAIKGSEPFIVHPIFWHGLSVGNPNKYLLFEGCTEGTGELVMTFHDSYGNLMSEGPGVWLEILDIKQMYVRSEGNQFLRPSWDETDSTIVFVHGWKMSPEARSQFAETFYKRLWHRGFKGRYAAFQWNTHYSNAGRLIPFVGTGISAYLSKYNESEQIAWESADQLKSFVHSLPGTKKHIAAHSMGNIVASEAVRIGMNVQNYAMMQAAVPSAAYDEHERTKYLETYKHLTFTMWDKETPDDDPDPNTRYLGYRGRFKNLGTRANLINFFLPKDYATFIPWEVNNDQGKPEDGMFAKNFRYIRNNPDGQKLYKYKLIPQNVNGHVHYREEVDYYLTAAYEAMSHACSTWGKAVGAQNVAQGAINPEKSVALNTPRFQLPEQKNGEGFGDQHSGQFTADIQYLKAFYNVVLCVFGEKVNP